MGEIQISTMALAERSVNLRDKLKSSEPDGHCIDMDAEESRKLRVKGSQLLSDVSVALSHYKERCAELEARCKTLQAGEGETKQVSVVCATDEVEPTEQCELQREREARKLLEAQLAASRHENSKLKILAMDSQEKAEELEGALAHELVARIEAEEESVALAKQRDQLEGELRVIVEEIAVMKDAMMCI